MLSAGRVAVFSGSWPSQKTLSPDGRQRHLKLRTVVSARVQPTHSLEPGFLRDWSVIVRFSTSSLRLVGSGLMLAGSMICIGCGSPATPAVSAPAAAPKGEATTSGGAMMSDGMAGGAMAGDTMAPAMKGDKMMGEKMMDDKMAPEKMANDKSGAE